MSIINASISTDNSVITSSTKVEQICTIGHLGWNVIDGFAYGELGYVVHAVAKDKPEVTNDDEKIATTNTIAYIRENNLDKYHKIQKQYLARICEYQKKIRYDDE